MIRAHGISCHGLKPLTAVIDEPWCDSVNTRINAYGKSMDGPPEQVAAVLRKIHAAGKGLVGMKLVGEGRFANDGEKKDRSIRFALEQGKIDTMVVGFEKTDQVDDFASRVGKIISTPTHA